MTPNKAEAALIAKLKEEFPSVWEIAMKEALDGVELIALEFCRAAIKLSRRNT